MNAAAAPATDRPAEKSVPSLPDLGAEWLETDGLGGFASGTVGGIRERRYHGLLAAAVTPPTGRKMLVNAVEAWVETENGSFPLSAHRYRPDVVHPDGARSIVEFRREPWPRWVYDLGGGLRVEQQFFRRHGAPLAVLTWKLLRRGAGARLHVRPLLSGRDLHALHRENSELRFAAARDGWLVRWAPYDGLPGVAALASGSYHHDPLWYRGFLYREERERGYDHHEDLAAPGVFCFDLAQGEACLILAAEGPGAAAATLAAGVPASSQLEVLRGAEARRRARFATPLDRAADAYLVQRGAGLSIVAGYPWFTDWGRDTFIALRGLCLATGRLEEAGAVLRQWAGLTSQGMLPNRFVDGGEDPEFNSADASLWFVIAVHEYLEAAAAAGRGASAAASAELRAAAAAILDGYAAGSRYGIHAAADGLLACGEPGWQLTWMDARVGARVVTPRIGKPVEVQALWINALRAGESFDSRWAELRGRAERSFAARFWNVESGCLYDVVDSDHVPGAADASLRPNQLLAVGGLPWPLLGGRRARAVVDAVEARLWTPLGPRSLAAADPRYRGVYSGGVEQRDGAYHQGTVWPWLAGAFVEAWVRARGATAAAKRAARRRFLPPLLAHLDAAGLGHVSEIADGDAPHAPRGCPFQAWSLGELLRLDRKVLALP